MANGHGPGWQAIVLLLIAMTLILTVIVLFVVIKTGGYGWIRGALGISGIKVSLFPAHTKDFFNLAETGTPQSVQTAIDIDPKLAKAADVYGKTALMYAAQKNQNPKVITTFLRAGADINA